MEYKVLYRKYRPTSFNDVIGQEAIINTLKNSIIRNKIAHAYIFSGMRGTGKTSIAKIFAKTINCLNIKDGISCDSCNNCNTFLNSPDIIELDAASNNGVDNIREIVINSRLVPNMYKYKVYIIDEVHMLSTGAFNALLKTLEEPLDHVVFILATTDIQKVPPTILSRCQRFDFNKINIDTMNSYLKLICEKENIKFTEEALNEISILSEGALRDALGLLDQISKQNEVVSLELIESIVGTVSITKIKELVDCILNKDIDNVIKTMQLFKDKRYDINIIIKKLINLLAIEFTNNKQLYVKNILKGVNVSYQSILNSFDPYLALEIVIIDYIDNIEDNKKENFIKDEVKPINQQSTVIIKNEKKIIKKDNIVDKNQIKYKNINEYFDVIINNCFVNANKESLKQSKIMWNKILSDLENKNINIFSIISQSIVVLSSDSELVVSLPTQSEVLLIKNKYDLIVKFMVKYKMNIVFISEDDWNILKNKYIDNLKNNIIYELKEVPKLIKEKDDKIEDEAAALFGENNVDVV